MAAKAVTERPRWQVAIGDAFGLMAGIWAIPVAIIIVGVPVALLFALARMVWRAL